MVKSILHGRGLRRVALAMITAAYLAAITPASARVVEETGRDILIRVSRGQTTEVVFSEAIRHIATSLTKDAISFEVVGTRLYLSPLSDDLSGTLFVLLESDRSVPIALVTAAPPTARDVSVKVVSPSQVSPARTVAAQGLTPLGLLRAMLVNQELAGVKISPAQREVYNDQAVKLTLQQVWRAPQLEGDLLVAENLRGTWIRLPIERIHFPGLLAIHVESEVLAPQPATPEEKLASRHRTRVFLIRLP